MNFTFLTKRQIYGKKKIEVFKPLGAKAAITDFAIVAGGYVSNDYYIYGKNQLEDRTGYYWTQTREDENSVNIVNEDGDYHLADLNFSLCGCRLVLNLEDEWSNFLTTNFLDLNDNEIEYGYYPQQAVSKEIQQELESTFDNGKIILLKNTYTSSFGQYSVYEYQNKKYVRVEIATVYNRDKVLLSNGEIYHNGDYVWIEVMPVKWNVLKEEKILLSKKILCAGLEFSKEKYLGDFIHTNIYHFMNNVLLKELFIKNFIPLEEEQQDSKIKNKNYRLEATINKLFLTQIEDNDFFNTDWNNSLLLNFDNKEYSFSLLDEEQVGKLSITKKGTSAIVTPFALLEGANSVPKEKEIFGSYWTKTIEYGFHDLRSFSSMPANSKAAMVIVEGTSQRSIADVKCHHIGGRPLLIFEDFCHFLRNTNLKINDDETINLGYFPQDFVSIELQQELENNYQEMELSFTDKTYSYIKNGNLNYLESLDEYEYKNRKYVRLENVSSTNELVTEKALESSSKRKKVIWIEVKPVKWIILTDRMLLCDKIIFTSNFENYSFSSVEDSQIYQWMNKNLREMLFQESSPLEEMKRHDNQIKKEQLKQLKKILIQMINHPGIIELFTELAEELVDDKLVQDSYSKVRKK